MSATNNVNNNHDMQISIKYPILTEIVKNCQENYEGDKFSNEDSLNIFTKPVRLSAFSKELKEAENEPIPDFKYNEMDIIDEVDNKEDEELLEELDESVDLSSIELGFVDKKPLHVEYNEKHDKSAIDMNIEEEKAVLNVDDDKPKESVIHTIKWLATPVSKAVHINSFLTPNVINTNTKSYFNGFFTQVRDRSRFKVLNDKVECLNNQIGEILHTDSGTSTKKLLFSNSKKKPDCNKDVIFEDKDETNDKENYGKHINDNFSNIYSSQMEKLILHPFEKITVNKVEYVILNQIGQGGSSVIFHCYDLNAKCERAIKRVSLMGDQACVSGYINEVKMLDKLQNCDRIIKMYSYELIRSERILLMVLEKGEKDLATIFKEISNNKNHLPMYKLIYYWMEMLYAVKQIHRNGIIHSDLKPANFLMVSSKLKLIDFGIASSLQTDMTSVIKDVQIGSFNYISPEALMNNSQEGGAAKFKISYRTDVWSLGCILYQLVYNKTPFKHIGHTYAKLSAIIDPKHVIDYAQVDWVPQNIIEIMKSCLQYDIKSRPSVDDLIKYFKNIYY